MKQRKTLDTKLIMSFKPCSEWPESRVKEAVPKRIAVTEFLRDKRITPADRLWVALHDELASDRIMRIFSCDCADRALRRERRKGRTVDPRSLEAVKVARRHADGDATDEELEAAWEAAREAAWSAAWSAACEAAERREITWQCKRLAELLEANNG